MGLIEPKAFLPSLHPIWTDIIVRYGSICQKEGFGKRQTKNKNLMIYSFKGFVPVVDPSAFVHSQATVTGDVIIGKDVYIAPGTALRGDWGRIIIEDGCNVQENCTLHMFPGKTVILRESAHIGHGAVIHGAEVGKNSLVGMNAVIMDDVQIGTESIIGALAFVKAEEKIPPRSLVVGNPARIIKQVSDEMIAWKTQGTKIYQRLPAELQDTLKEVAPLTELSDERKNQQIEVNYKTWNDTKQP